MATKSIFTLFAAAALLMGVAMAFSPIQPMKTASFVTSTSNNHYRPSTFLKMSQEPPKEGEAAKKSGDLYDDETPEYKPAISDTMRERLLKEASTGLDANQKQTNVILYISIAIAILVALGGSGILY